MEAADPAALMAAVDPAAPMVAVDPAGLNVETAGEGS